MAKPMKLYKSYAGSAQDYEFVKEYLETHGGLPKDYTELVKSAVFKRNESQNRCGQDYILVPGKLFYLVRKGTLDVRAAKLRRALEEEVSQAPQGKENELGAAAVTATTPLLDESTVVLHHEVLDRIAITDEICGLTVAVAYHEGRFEGNDLDVKVYNRDQVLLAGFEAGCAINPLRLGYKDYTVSDIVKAANDFGYPDFGLNLYDLSLRDDKLVATLIPTHREMIANIKEKGRTESYLAVLNAQRKGTPDLIILAHNARKEREALDKELRRKTSLGYPMYPRGSHERGKLIAKINALDNRAKLAYKLVDQLREEDLIPVESRAVKTSPFLDDVALASLTAIDSSGMIFIDSISDLEETWGYTKADLADLRDEVAHYGLDAVVDISLDPKRDGKDYVLATYDIAGVEIKDLQSAVGEYAWAKDHPWSPRPSVERARDKAKSLSATTRDRSTQPQL